MDECPDVNDWYASIEQAAWDRESFNLEERGAHELLRVRSWIARRPKHLRKCMGSGYLDGTYVIAYRGGIRVLIRNPAG